MHPLTKKVETPAPHDWKAASVAESDAIDLKWRAEKTLEHLSILVEQSNEWARDSSRGFHQAMITLSAGAVTASLLFTEKIAPKPWKGTLLLVLSWACFTVSLVSIVIAFRRFSTERDLAQQRLNDWVYRLCFGELKGGDAETLLGPATTADIPPNRSRVFGFASVGAFALGVVLLTWFAGKNLL